jgi:putative ABC transport system permease protein
MVVGGFCVFNTVSMTALERRRELATLRAVGGSRRRLLAGFLAEMMLLGVVGSAMGAALGYLLGGRLINAIPAVFVDQVGVRPTFVVSAGLLRTALLLGTLVTVCAAVAPARAAVSVAPVEAMRPEGPAESAPSNRANSVVVGIVGALLFVGGSVVAVAGADKATLIGFGTITVGTLILTYGVRASIARAAAAFAGLFGSSGRLAGASVERAPRRTWATVTAVSIAVGAVVAVGGVADNLLFTYRAPFESMKRPDLWINTAPLSGIPVNLRFDDRFALRLAAAVPWIGRVVGTQDAYTTFGKDRILTEGFDVGTTVPTYATARPASRRALFDDANPGMIVNAAFADRNAVKVGDHVTLRTPIGPQSFRVLDVVDVPSPGPAGRIGIDRRLLEKFYGRFGLSFIEVYGKKGVSPEQLKRFVTAALRTSNTPAYVATGEEQYQAVVASLRQSTAIFEAMRAAVVLATALALANAMLISVIERRRELGIVRAVGTSRRQLRRMVVIESVAIGVVGSVIGALLGLLQHRVGDDAVGSLVKSTIQYRFVTSPVIIGLVAMGATVILAALMPAARAANVNVIEAIGYE